MGNTFNLKKFLAEGKLLKEEFNISMDGDYVELKTDSGEYLGFIEDDGTVSFSVIYDDEEDRDGMEFDEDNWRDILGPNHAFVRIINSIGGKVEALDDYVMITVDVDKLKDI